MNEQEIISNSIDDLTKRKWKKFYKDSSKNDLSVLELRHAKELKQNYFNRFFNFDSEQWFLEVGVENGVTFIEVADKCKAVALDISLDACKQVKKMSVLKGTKAYIVCGDILNLPFKAEVFNLIYGGGTIEHFVDTSSVIRNLSRICRKNGGLFMTVPRISFLYLTVGQLWGNIPDVFLLREVMIFFHFHLLKGKHLKYGLEKSFLQRTIRSLFQKNGFPYCSTGVYHIYHHFPYIRSNILRFFLNILIKFDLFNHHIYGVGKKSL